MSSPGPVPTRILLLEDNPADAELVMRELGKLSFPVEARWVVTPEAYQRALREFAPELILSDHNVPAFSGRAALSMARNMAMGVPFILITASLNEEMAVDYMKAGAADYIIKDRLLRLVPAIETALERDRSIRESESRYRSLYMGVPVGLFRTSADGQILDANTALAHLLGYDSADDLTATIAVDWYIDPADRQRWRDRLNHERSVSGFEVRLRRRDGEQIWVRESARAVRDSAGAVSFYEGMIEDVTEKRLAEEALRQQHSILNAVIEGTPNPIFVKDVEGRYLVANSAAARVLGHAKENILGKRDAELVAPDVAQQSEERHRLVLESEHTQTFERDLSVQGEVRHFLYDKGVYRDAEGNVAGVFGISRDITDRKRAEDELRAREGFLRSLVVASPVGIFRTNGEGRLVYVTPRFCEISGLTEEEAMEVGARGTLHPDDRDQMLARWAECTAAERPYEGEFRVVRHDGQTRIVHLNAAPMFSDDGALRGYVGTVEDITQRKTLEEQFRQAQKMESIGQLAGSVAHDFNNLLTVILSYAGILKESLTGDDDLLECVGEIDHAATRSAELTKQLLAFSRKQVLKPRILDLNQVIGEVNKILGRLLQDSVQLRTALASDLGWVLADPGQMEQVIMNLTINARDAMPNGGQVTIATHNVEIDATNADFHPWIQAGSYAMLSVNDTGVGMEPQVLSRIFEPFFTTKEVGKGTGLGLATVYGIVKQSNGHLEVDSTPGVGTTFNIYLPRVPPPAGT